jgi:hypothetical protein
MVLKTTGEGHAITTAAPGLYAMQDVPDKNIARLRIVIRPGAGQTVPIRSVFVRAWAGDSN